MSPRPGGPALLVGPLESRPRRQLLLVLRAEVHEGVEGAVDVVVPGVDGELVEAVVDLDCVGEALDVGLHVFPALFHASAWCVASMQEASLGFT